METMREREVCVVVCASGRDLRTWESLAPPQARLNRSHVSRCVSDHIHYTTVLTPQHGSFRINYLPIHRRNGPGCKKWRIPTPEVRLVLWLGLLACE
jgi:hypothetical protein